MKAVLFDFNGTLFSDTRFHAAAWKRFTASVLNLQMTEEEIVRRCIGPANYDIFHDFLGPDVSDEEVLRLSGEKERMYREVVRADVNNMKLMDGAPEMLDLLTARGIPFALATASPIENVEFYLEDLGLKRWFTLDRIVYEDGKLPGKPDPAFYLEAARRIGVPPSDCLIAEDSPTGILAATRAGAGRIIAIDRTAPRDWLESNPSLYAVVHDFYGFERYL